ncbi:MAG: hypothetical protein SGPRY_010160 [Prymnesium sp.]
MNTDFTSREMMLCFVWSRMRVFDMSNKAAINQLHFEDFLEALVRVAATKTLPTDEHLFEAGFDDAGEFFLTLSADPKLTDELAEYVAEFAHTWCAARWSPSE